MLMYSLRVHLETMQKIDPNSVFVIKNVNMTKDEVLKLLDRAFHDHILQVDSSSEKTMAES